MGRPNMIIFEENSPVRDLVACIARCVPYVNSNKIAVNAASEPWNAEDLVDLDTVLAIVGDSRRPYWDGLSFVKDIPSHIVTIVGSPSWSYERRAEFVRAGAMFTYDLPFNVKSLEVMIKCALKLGPFLKSVDCKGECIVATHLPYNSTEFITEKIPQK